MARDIDTIINYVKGLDYIPPVMKQVIVNRLDPPPSKTEIETAKEQVYPTIKNNDPWKVS